MLTFHQGGTMMDGTTTPSALRTPAEGVWRNVGNNTYAFRMKSFTFNAQNILTGWSIIAGELTVDATGNTGRNLKKFVSDSSRTEQAGSPRRSLPNP